LKFEEYSLIYFIKYHYSITLKYSQFRLKSGVLKVVKVLLFTGFVGGYGGISKVSKTYCHLKDKGLDPKIVTVSGYQSNLPKFNLKADLIIPQGNNFKENSQNVLKGLNSCDYDLMVSFGPRTYGPRHAVEHNKRSVIIDGGLPDKYQKGTEYDAEVYRNLDAFIATCYFPWEIPQEIKANYPGMTIKVLSQPINEKQRAYLRSLQSDSQTEIHQRKSDFLKKRGIDYDGSPIVTMRMAPGYAKTSGSFLSLEEITQAQSHLKSLAETLAVSGERMYLMTENEPVTHAMKQAFPDQHNIQVVSAPFLPHDDSLELVAISDINIDRATRNVVQSEIAAVGGYTIVSPCPKNYMHEDIAAEQAEGKGLIKHLPVGTLDIGQRVLDYLGTQHYHDSRKLRM
jgi:hypothetical protein